MSRTNLDWLLVLLYSEYSESYWSAGWMDTVKNHRGPFSRWLGAAHQRSFEDYELADLPILREVWEETIEALGELQASDSIDRCDSCGKPTEKKDLSMLMGQSIFYCPPCYRDFEKLYREIALGETEEA